MTSWFLLILLFASLASGCASPTYVLGTHRHASWPSSVEETAPITATNGIALLYDRARWVALEHALPDGSVWVHYALLIKNRTSKVIQLNLEKVRLKGKNGIEVPAVFATHDLKEGQKEVGAGSLLRITTRFHIPASVVQESANSPDPLDLIVPLQDKNVLQGKVWLWKD